MNLPQRVIDNSRFNLRDRAKIQAPARAGDESPDYTPEREAGITNRIGFCHLALSIEIHV